MQFTQADYRHSLNEVNHGVGLTLADTAEPNAFIRYFLKSVRHDFSSIRSFIDDIQAETAASFSASFLPVGEPLPKITHRIWITDLETPTGVPNSFDDNLTAAIKDVTPDFVNVFWSNSDAVLRDLRSRIGDTGLRVYFLNVAELRDDLGYTNFLKLITDKKFVLASDLFRVIALKRFGGIYSDLGVSYSRKIVELAVRSNVLLFLAKEGFFQTSLLGFPAGHDLINLFHGVLCNPNVIDSRWISDGGEIHSVHEVNVLAGPCLTALAYLFLNKRQRVLIVSPNVPNVTWTSLRSWYGDQTSFGNTHQPSSQLSLLSNAAVAAHSLNMDEAVKAYDCAPATVYKFRIILGLSEYFWNEPTALCKIMRYRHSDKALGWHNYTPIYNYIIGPLDMRSTHLVEIGIGTNFLDAVSTMGAEGVPGASLRGWREFFPGAIIVGADVDRRILFTENQIDTYFTDQLDLQALESLKTRVHEKGSVAILIDDGLHTLEANMNVINVFASAVLPGGVLIVEDIISGYLNQWETWLAESRYPALLVRVPHDTNKSDNNLVFLFTKG